MGKENKKKIKPDMEDFDEPKVRIEYLQKKKEKKLNHLNKKWRRRKKMKKLTKKLTKFQNIASYLVIICFCLAIIALTLGFALIAYRLIRCWF